MKAKSRQLNAKQRKFITLMPQIVAGKLSVEGALKKAGYSKATARQQSNTIKRIRINTAMQDALKKAGVNEAFLATKIFAGTNGKEAFNYIKLAAELMDAFPSQKIDADININEELNAAEKEGDYAEWPD